MIDENDKYVVIDGEDNEVATYQIGKLSINDDKNGVFWGYHTLDEVKTDVVSDGSIEVVVEDVDGLERIETIDPETFFHVGGGSND